MPKNNQALICLPAEKITVAKKTLQSLLKIANINKIL